MPGDLLRNKLYIPQLRRNAVERLRLLTRFNPVSAGYGAPTLTLISAPAGFGKTTLLAAWAAQHPLPVGWLSLDDSDNDPLRFLAYVIAALNTVVPQAGREARAMLQSPQPAPSQAILTALINDLDEVATPFSLVMDDYHVIVARPVHEMMAFLLDHLPACMRLVIATRADPFGLPLARLRARGQLIELRAADLRFTVDEAAEFLDHVMGLRLTAENVAALEARTEGWIAGLQMAAIALQDRQDVTEFTRALSGNQRYILDYLVEEVLNRQPVPLQTFLLYTSILDRMCGPLCDALMEVGDSRLQIDDANSQSPFPDPQPPVRTQQILSSLERANLFVVPLDDEQRWYRYHHLFADLLRARLQQTNPEQVAELHRKAARWFERNGLEDEAIQHALAAKDYVYAAQLIEQNSYAILTRGQLTTCLEWMRSLPGELVRSRPRLSVLSAMAFNFAGQWERVEPLLRQAEQQLEAGQKLPDVREVSGTIAVLCAHQAEMHGDLPRAIELAQHADQLLPGDAELMRSLVPFTLARAYRAQGDLQKAALAAAEIVRIGRAIDNVWTFAVGTTTLAGIRRIQGRLRETAGLFDDAARFATERDSRNFGTVSGIDTGMADLLREWNELETAQRHTQAAIDHLGSWANPTDLAWANIVLARIHMARGDPDAAHQALQEADRVRKQHRVFPQIDVQVDVDWVKLWLARGDVDAAARWTEQQASESVSIAMLDMELKRMACARVLMAQRRWGEAAQWLARLAIDTENGGRNGRLIEILALHALVLSANDDTPAALAMLYKSLALARPEGYVRIFVDEGAPMRLLLQYARQQGHGHREAGTIDYVDRLLASFPRDAHMTGEAEAFANNPGNNRQSTFGVESLSDREMEVLRLLAAGLSNTQIAKRLFVTTGTVKTHVHNIYGKLNAQNRAQAVALAKELNLL